MQIMGKDNVEEVKELLVNPKLPSLWVDLLEPSIRDDGVCLIRLATSLPEGDIEQARFMTSENALKEFVSIVCNAINFYPSQKAGDSITTD